MRIIAGNNRGTVLKAPKGSLTRPTLGRVRESLFSILGGTLDGPVVVDFFAGAGGLGFEALSRGAKRCYFVDKAHAATECLRANAAKMRYETRGPAAQAIIQNRDVFSFCKAPPDETVNLVFLDPPYYTDQAQRLMTALGDAPWLAPHALVVCQCGAREQVADAYGDLVRYRTALYGETAIHFYTKQTAQ